MHMLVRSWKTWCIFPFTQMSHLMLLLWICCLWKIVHMRVFGYKYKTTHHSALLTYFPSCSAYWPTHSGSWRAGKAAGAAFGQWGLVHRTVSAQGSEPPFGPSCTEYIPVAWVAWLLWLLLWLHILCLEKMFWSFKTFKGVQVMARELKQRTRGRYLLWIIKYTFYGS